MSLVSKSTFSIVLIFLFSLSFAHLSSAQSIPGITEPITFQVAPQYPKPNTDVTISAQSFSTDLNRAKFTWSVNGKVVKQGNGITQISVPSGKAGIKTSVSVTVNTSDIGVITNDTSWRPADVTVMWQSDGHTPPFYKGKALELYGSTFKVTAIPEFFTSAGKRLDPKTLIYTWKKNGGVEADQSGYGRDSYTGSQTSYVRGADDISVEVSTSARDIGATRTISITPGTADSVFYENSPLYGIQYEKALSGNLKLLSEEITLRVENYNISPGTLSIDWIMNKANISAFKDKNEITLRKSAGTTGISVIELSVEHPKMLLQGGQARISIIQ